MWLSALQLPFRQCPETAFAANLMKKNKTRKKKRLKLLLQITGKRRRSGVSPDNTERAAATLQNIFLP